MHFRPIHSIRPGSCCWPQRRSPHNTPRWRTAEGKVARLSFTAIRDCTAAMYKLPEPGEDLMTLPWEERALRQLAQVALIAIRKARGSRRAVRQPVKERPKMNHPTSTPLA